MRRPFNVAVNITQEYGASEPGSRRGYHTGVDYGMPSGSDVVSPTNGIVHENGDGRAAADGRGYFVTIVGDDGIGHCLYHLSQNNIVATGTRVSEGQLVAKSGNTGQSTGPHLHWETRKGVDNNTSDFAPANWLFAGLPTATTVTSAPATNTAPATTQMIRIFGDYRTLWSNSNGTGKINQVAPNQFPAKYLDYKVLATSGNYVKIQTQMYGQGWVLAHGSLVDSITMFYNA